MTEKRYEHWVFKDGKHMKEFTDWFPWNSDNRDPIQLKGFKGNHLKNEYRTIG